MNKQDTYIIMLHFLISTCTQNNLFLPTPVVESLVKSTNMKARCMAVDIFVSILKMVFVALIVLSSIIFFFLAFKMIAREIQTPHNSVVHGHGKFKPVIWVS